MKSLVIFIFTTLLSFSAWASPEQWAGLLNKIEQQGQYYPTPFEDYLSLSDVKPNDREKDRIASYISAVGYYDQDMKFQMNRIETVWEDWKRDQNGNFRVDQWLFKLSTEQQMISYSRSILILTPTGSHLDSEYPKTTDEEFNRKWAEILPAWYN